MPPYTYQNLSESNLHDYVFFFSTFEWLQRKKVFHHFMASWPRSKGQPENLQQNLSLFPGRHGDVKVSHLGTESDGINGGCFPSKIGSWDRIPNGPYQVSCDRAIFYPFSGS